MTEKREQVVIVIVVNITNIVCARKLCLMVPSMNSSAKCLDYSILQSWTQ
jgi:hypothetical protein